MADIDDISQFIVEAGAEGDNDASISQDIFEINASLGDSQVSQDVLEVSANNGNSQISQLVFEINSAPSGISISQLTIELGIRIKHKNKAQGGFTG